MGESIDLVNDERYLSLGDRYIKFDSERKRFAVYIKSDTPMRVRVFNNIISAVNCARRV